MIKPLLQDDALLADIESAKSDRPNFRLWWLGQSGFLMQFNGRHALVDPYLYDSLTAKYEQSDKPHVRMTERVIAPERLGFVDVVSSSHNHTDHFNQTVVNFLNQTVVWDGNQSSWAELNQSTGGRSCG